MKTVTTHNGSFHTDEILAVATILLTLPEEEVQVIRTRDESKYEASDYVVDVGGIYESKKGRFDHHQEGGAGKRENGIPYASFGLVWKEYGLKLCQNNEEAWKKIDLELATPVDAHDNGVAITTNLYKDVYPYTIGKFFASFHPDHEAEKADIDKAFMTAVNLAKDLLLREISKAIEYVTLEHKVIELYDRAEDKRIIVLDGRYPWERVLVERPEPVYAVYFNEQGDRWTAKGVPPEVGSFDRRKFFPEEWAGKKDEELQKITGVPDALFCHNGKFVVVAKSKEGAIALAKKSLEN